MSMSSAEPSASGKHFHIIVWVSLQNLCHMQCTGKELSAELSVEEKQQALQQAMFGKRVLLCLDVSAGPTLTLFASQLWLSPLSK